MPNLDINFGQLVDVRLNFRRHTTVERAVVIGPPLIDDGQVFYPVFYKNNDDLKATTPYYVPEQCLTLIHEGI